jgi:hypothetical protein
MNGGVKYSDRYLARLDAELRRTATGERERLLQQQFARWEKLYAEFLAEEDCHPDGPQANDFFLTLCGISERLAAIHSGGV